MLVCLGTVPPRLSNAELALLLAVAEAGHRVGNGGSFYDQLLSQCGPGTQFIGPNVLDGAPIALHRRCAA